MYRCSYIKDLSVFCSFKKRIYFQLEHLKKKKGAELKMQELNINSKNKWAEHNILLTIILLIHILQSFFFLIKK